MRIPFNYLKTKKRGLLLAALLCDMVRMWCGGLLRWGCLEGLLDEAVDEGFHSLGVFCGVVGIGPGVLGAVGYVLLFVASGLGVVELIEHVVGDKGVAVAVDEEHGQGRFLHLFQR